MATAAAQTTLDVQDARQQASFDPNTLNQLLSAGSRDQTLRRRVADVLARDPRFDKTPRSYLSRAQQLERGFRLTRDLFAVVDENNWNAQEYAAALSLVDEPIGLNLHEIAFTPVIESQGSDEQQREWLPKCYSHEILGCYLQTELGHGSNVQQLETTATYDADSDEFVLHSGPISATKWSVPSYIAVFKALVCTSPGGLTMSGDMQVDRSSRPHVDARSCPGSIDPERPGQGSASLYRPACVLSSDPSNVRIQTHELKLSHP